MKIAIITDTHFGARSDSLHFNASFERFYEEGFFPTLKALGIKTVVHMGDVFDRRKYINFQILKSCRKYFFDKLQAEGIDIHIIPGNHDTYFKNTNEVNSLDLLLSGYDNIEIVSEVTEKTFGSMQAIFVPWICEANFEDSMAALDNTQASVCFGHFAIEGFEMHKGMGSEGGFDPALFGKFDAVYTGHFHHKSANHNIYYLGSPYEMTWSDYDDPKGFHILDTETGVLGFVTNPDKMHRKIYYDDSKKMKIDPTEYQGSCVKVIVINKKDYQKFDKMIDALYANNVIDLKILEDFSDFESDALDDEPVNLEDTLTLLSDYIDSLSLDVKKDRLKLLLKGLYIEAQNYHI